ncbi:hypothetical protein D3C80_1948370 [compost metagenome]
MTGYHPSSPNPNEDRVAYRLTSEAQTTLVDWTMDSSLMIEVVSIYREREYAMKMIMIASHPTVGTRAQ